MSSSTGLKYANGQIKCTNATLELRVLGFQPKKVKLQNLTNGTMLEWCSALPSLAGNKTVAAGTRSYVTTNGVTPLPGSSTQEPGFSIGAMTDLNDDTTETLLWEAEG